MVAKTGRKAINVPKRSVCRIHGVPLVYQSEKLQWACPTDGCQIVKILDISSDDGKPIVVNGDLSLVVKMEKDGTEEVFLRVANNNLLIRVTPNMLGPVTVSTNQLGSDFTVSLVMKTAVTLQ